MIPELPPSSYAVLVERFSVVPVLCISFNRRKSILVMVLRSIEANVPGIVERILSRPFTPAPSRVVCPVTLSSVPAVR